jgi:hypothetical protein
VGGQDFQQYVYPTDGRVVEVRIRSQTTIDQIDVIVEDSAGHRRSVGKHGGEGGQTRPTLVLDADEFITAVRGRYGNVVDSIEIVTNKRTESFGGTGGGAAYAYNAPPGTEIAGFIGRSQNVIDAIGVLIRPRVGT